MNYQVSQPQALGYTPQQTNAAFNQQLAQAQASADKRYNMKPMDRAGVSRGQGQQYMAGIASAQNLADGVSKAYAGRMSDASQNAEIAMGNATAGESLGLGVSAIDQQNRYAHILAALQRQQAGNQYTNNILGGLTNGGWLNGFLGF